MKQFSNDTQRLTANVLKKIITSFLLTRDSNDVIGYEVMYGSSRRVADMVFISKGYAYAIEIKSEFDKLSRLKVQLQEYQSLFDYIIIFSAPNHINSINALLPNNIGLYCIRESDIRKVRREKINHNVKKSEMLISIPSAIIKKDFSIKGKLTSDEIRAIAIKKSYKTIHRYFVDFFKTKLFFSSFHEETRDVASLQQPNDYLII